jgi:hypothetical protein
MRHLVIALVLGVVTAARPAAACSLTGTYIAPTNVELIAASTNVVIARATGAAGGEAVTFEVEQVVRGRGLKIGDVIALRGSLGHYLGASPALDFSRPRPGAFIGGCIAYDYALGRHYVLLLAPYNGGWAARGGPFTRVNEEVDGANAPWAVAVRAYARIADLASAADRRKALETLVARGTAAKATPTEKVIAADVNAHLAAATPAKSFAELEALEQAGTATHASVLLAVGRGGDPAARAYMAKAVADLRATATVDQSAVEAVAAYYEDVSDPAVLGQLAAYYVDLGSQAPRARWPLMLLLIDRAGASDRAVMLQALLDANDEEASQLGAWFVRFPSAKAEQELLRRLGGSFRAGGAPARFQTMFALAGMGNKAVLAWAKRELASSTTSDDRWVAPYVIALSPLRTADALVPGIIARGGDDLVHLVEGYRDARHRHADRRLAALAKRTDLDAEAHEATLRSIEVRQARP